MSAKKRLNALAVVAGAILITNPATAEPACYRIDATAQCEAEYPPGFPNDSECRVPGWARLGPYWEVYVSQKTLLFIPGSSGMTMTTRKCRRVYVLIQDGKENQLCYGGSYGTAYRSFATNDCVVGGGGT